MAAFPLRTLMVLLALFQHGFVNATTATTAMTTTAAASDTRTTTASRATTTTTSTPASTTSSKLSTSSVTTSTTTTSTPSSTTSSSTTIPTTATTTTTSTTTITTTNCPLGSISIVEKISGVSLSNLSDAQQTAFKEKIQNALHNISEIKAANISVDLTTDLTAGLVILSDSNDAQPIAVKNSVVALRGSQIKVNDVANIVVTSSTGVVIATSIITLPTGVSGEAAMDAIHKANTTMTAALTSDLKRVIQKNLTISVGDPACTAAPTSGTVHVLGMHAVVAIIAGLLLLSP